MDINEHTSPQKLERYAFLWSLARLIIAAVSLFFGAMPIVYMLGGSSGILVSLLPLFWLISGVAAVYLLYTWHKGGQKLFGKTDRKDKVIFFIMAITGLNLGYTALSSNIGMEIAWSFGPSLAEVLIKATAIIYLIVAYHLWTQWKKSGGTLFSTGQTPPEQDTSSPENKPS